jgi:hypothetical protein
MMQDVMSCGLVAITMGNNIIEAAEVCLFFQSLKGGCLLWATALLAAGQSGAINNNLYWSIHYGWLS